MEKERWKLYRIFFWLNLDFEQRLYTYARDGDRNHYICNGNEEDGAIAGASE